MKCQHGTVYPENLQWYSGGETFAHFIMYSLHFLLLMHTQDRRFCPVSTIFVREVRDPKPGLARGVLGGFLVPISCLVGAVVAVNFAAAAAVKAESVFPSEIPWFAPDSLECTIGIEMLLAVPPNSTEFPAISAAIVDSSDRVTESTVSCFVDPSMSAWSASTESVLFS